MSPVKFVLLIAATMAITSVAARANAQGFNRTYLHNTSFEETVNRYPAPLAIIENIKSVAPFQEAAGMTDSCLQIGSSSSTVLGAIDPAQIQPLEQNPGALFFNYFEKCVKKIVKLGFQNEGLAKQNAEAILGADLMRTLSSATGQSRMVESWSTPFNRLAPAAQQQLVDQFIYFLLGPEDFLRYYKYIGDRNVFAQPLNTAADLRSFLIEQLNKSPASQNDSVLGFYSRLAVLLRLGPALKN
ncbi:hypothetical protein BH10BDE1_BH10BDE1_01060 [soil metagenome]